MHRHPLQNLKKIYIFRSLECVQLSLLLKNLFSRISALEVVFVSSRSSIVRIASIIRITPKLENAVIVL